jgi:CubicO group peptidase (beta-lactamase class C family)
MNIETHPRLLFLVNIGLVSMLLAGCAAPVATPVEEVGNAEPWDQFEAELEYLRQQMHIPGLAAAVVMDQELAWARGFGYADLENRIPATPDTPFHLASVTKTLAATLIMQLVEEGVISLDDPVSDYGIDLDSQGTVRVRHLLTHTSSGVPGTVFRYDGGAYALLSRIAEQATGQSFGTLMQERILGPLGMTHTWMDYQPCAIALGLSPYPTDWDASVIQAALPYQLDPSYDVVDGIYTFRGFSAASGLLSTVNDLAKFDIALDQNVLLDEQSRDEMLALGVPIYPDRTDLTHGLGWFSQEFMGTQLNWHAGQMPPSASANIVRAPEQNLAFIVLANTVYLNLPWSMTDISYHTMALAFYETFVFPRQFGRTVPEVDWEASEDTLVNELGRVTDPAVRQVLERELWAYRQLYAAVGRSDLVAKLLRVHERAYPDSTPSALDLFMLRGSPQAISASLATDQVQLTEAQMGRLMGDYVLSDSGGAPANLPPEVRFQAVNGRPVVSFSQGCLDLVSLTPTSLTTPLREFTVSLQLEGDAVTGVSVRGPGFDAVYVPRE